MKPNAFPLPGNENARLRHLTDSELLDFVGGPDFDALAALAADILECPVSLISFLAEDQQVFKAASGMEASVSPREFAFCNHTILANEPLIVADARDDKRFKNNPLVTQDPHIVFYAGMPLSLDGEHNLGTLCVVDHKARNFSDEQIRRFKSVARAIEAALASYTHTRAVEHAQKHRKQAERKLARMGQLLEQITSLSGVGGWELDLITSTLTWTDETKRIHEVSSDYEPELDTALEFYTPEARPVISDAVKRATDTGEHWDIELPLTTARGRDIWVRAVGRPTYKGGKIISLIGAFQDITDRKVFENKLEMSKAAALSFSDEMRTILDNMDEGVSVFDAEGCLTLWNDNYAQIFEKDPQELRVGVSLKTLIENEKSRGDFTADVDAHIAELRDELAQGITSNRQFRLGNGRIVKSTHAPLPDGGWVGTHMDVTEQVLIAEQSEYAALHDTLTGLPNRLAFDRHVEHFADAHHRAGQQLITMLLDLNRFKAVNDTYGHIVGDKLLKRVARRLSDCLPQTAFLSRLGGDEFILLFEHSGKNAKPTAANIAARIVSEIGKPFQIEGLELDIGVSIGISIVERTDARVEEAILLADKALYATKNSAEQGFQFADNTPCDAQTHASNFSQLQ